MENQEVQPQPASLINHAVKNGVILGVISILLVVVVYAVDLTFLATLKFLGIILVLGLGYVIYAGINYRSEVGGYLGYGKAFMHGFILLAVSGLIGTAFNILLYHVVDPELPAKLTEAIIRNTEEMMAGFGTPQETIDQTIDGLRVEMPGNFSIGGLLYGYVKAMIWYCIIALITSLIVRKNESIEP